MGGSLGALQRFLGHASMLSTRRYARLADHALIEVLRPAKTSWRQALRDQTQTRSNT